MRGGRFFMTDVFATAKYSGNQLATVFYDGRMSDDDLQRIAAEFGFSETTFIMSSEPSDGAYPVRIFTPKAEIAFAGHPTLGTAFVLLRHVIGQAADRVDLAMTAGRIPVHRSESVAESGVLWMRQNTPEFEDGMDRERIAAVLGLASEDIDPRWPISQVTTGLPFTIVPLVSDESLGRARVSADRYQDWAESAWAKGILAFAFDGYTSEQDLSSRVFVPYLGVPEDPATGSASGCLAGYLLRHRVLGSDAVDLRIGQGYEIGRPSEILIRARSDQGQYLIDVGARVIEIASGTLET